MKKTFLKKILTLPPHPLTNFEIQEYYQNEPRFNGVFSRDNLPNNIKNGAYVINLDEYHDIGTHWVALYVYNKTAIYFDSFGVEHIPKEIIKLVARKIIIMLMIIIIIIIIIIIMIIIIIKKIIIIITNIYGIQACN